MPSKSAGRAGAALTACLLVAGLVAACTTSHPHPQREPSPPAPAPSTGVNIYTLLPFGPAALTVAVTTAARAAAAYQTFTWTDTPASYGARISPWVTPGFGQALQDTYGNPRVTAARAAARETSTATASVTSIATFGPTSITFLVSIQQHDPVTDSSGDYRVTVETSDGHQWSVNDIQPATAGNS